METMQKPPRSVTPSERTTTDVFGVRVDIILTGEDTGGAYCTYEASVPPGGGPPPHVHEREDEAFTILEGEFELLCGDQVTRAGAGTTVFFPRHVPHAFKNVGPQPGRLMGIAAPAGHEQFFLDADRTAKAGPLTPEVAIALLHRHGMDLAIPPER